MKRWLLVIAILSLPIVTSAGELALLRKDKEATFYYETDTVRRTGKFVMAWTVELRGELKYSEALTEFDCSMAMYRQLSLRSFASNSQVISGDAIYRNWFAVPDASQVVGLLFAKVCASGIR
jgi:hypothetical protein